MSGVTKKKKEKNLFEKEAIDDLKELKGFMSEGKMQLEKAV